MRLGRLDLLCLGLGTVLAVFCAARAQGGSGSDLELGRKVYLDHCAICHGENGDGQGQALSRLQVAPRDFTTGDYKLRSTPSGSLPTDDDLHRSIVRGLPGTAMIPQNHLSGDQVDAVIAYIKHFSERFAEEQPRKAIRIIDSPSRAEDSIERGRKAYETGRCAQCHGPEGRGNGPASESLSVPATDFTRRPLISGPEPRDLVRSILTGLDGTPMPSYHLFLTDEEIWFVAYYLESLGEEPVMTEDEKEGWTIEEREPPSP